MNYVVSWTIKFWNDLEGRLKGNRGEAYSWLYAFIIGGIYSLSVVLLLNRMYDYVDDLTLRDYVRAGMTVPFSGHFFSAGLGFLYQRVSSDFPWYSVFLLVVKFLSLVVVLYLIITKNIPAIYKWVGGILLMGFYVPFLMRYSWNTTSILAGGIATVAMVDSFQQGKRASVLKSILLGCLGALSYTIRRDGIMMILLDVIPPIAAFTLLFLILKKISFQKIILYGVIFALPILIVVLEDQNFVKNEFTLAERLHDAAQEARAPVYGYGVYGVLTSNLSLLKSSGWTAIDVYMIAYAMTMFDENKFSPERFLNVLNGDIGPGEEAIKRDMVYNWLHFGQLENFKWYDSNFTQYQLLPFYLAMLTFALLVLWGGKSVFHKLFSVSYLIYIYITSLYMVNYIKFPWYLSHSAYYIVCLVLFINMEVDYKKFSNGLVNRLASIVLLVVACAGFLTISWSIISLHLEIPVKRAEYFNRYYDFASRFGKDAFIFIRPQLYTEYYTDPFFLGDQGPDPSYGVLGVSSAAFSPLFYKYIDEKLGLKYGYEILPWMMDNPKAFFLTKEIKIVNWLMAFMRESFGIIAQFRPVYVYGDGLTAYEIKKVDPFLSRYQPVYNFMDNLENAYIGPESSEDIRVSQFRIMGTTQAVLFSHPDSEISYDVMIPSNARLRFSTAISSEAWFSEGDGVQFNIYLEDELGRHELFKEYIDPKLKMSDRRWHSHELNLEKWQGKQVRLTFITSSGPKGDSRFDWAGWGEPTIGQYTYFDMTRKFYLAYPKPSSLENTRISRRKVDGSFQDLIYQHPNGWLSFPVEVKPNSVFEFGIGLDPDTWSPEKGDGVRFDVVISDEGRNVRVFSKYVDPKNIEQDRRWFYETIDLREYANKQIEITLITLPGQTMDGIGNSAFDWAYWIAPRLVQRNEDSIIVTEEKPTPVQQSTTTQTVRSSFTPSITPTHVWTRTPVPSSTRITTLTPSLVKSHTPTQSPMPLPTQTPSQSSNRTPVPTENP